MSYPHMPPALSTTEFANRPCWRLTVAQGTAVVAQHGGQVLSWVPAPGDEVLWLSPQVQAPPAAARGGIPVCWPWFGKEGMPEGAMQHGPVRNRAWQMAGTPTVTAHRIEFTLQPLPATLPDDPLARYAPTLDLRLHITLDDALTLQLTTRNAGSAPVVLTQALHTYLAVGDVRRAAIGELANLPYHDKLTQATQQTHATPWRFEGPCDRIYQRAASAPLRHPEATYTVSDPVRQRRIRMHTQGSGAVVLWNPGAQGAHNLADVPDDAWPHFLCLEAANADSDRIVLAPGQSHTLGQRLEVAPWEATP